MDCGYGQASRPSGLGRRPLRRLMREQTQDRKRAIKKLRSRIASDAILSFEVMVGGIRE